jgi:hypothetical protein
MSFNMAGVITGAVVAGLTSPTYTLTADVAADTLARQSIVSALGGTQTGVSVHSIGTPFTVTVRRPRTLRVPGRPNLAGVITSIGRNTFTILVRKGVLPAASQPVNVAMARAEFEIPAGAETFDAPQVKALVSLTCGFMSTNASGIADTLINGLL